jgi:hypothetical protein
MCAQGVDDNIQFNTILSQQSSVISNAQKVSRYIAVVPQELSLQEDVVVGGTVISAYVD